MEPAVVLLSGGMDSTTCLAMAVSEGLEVHCLAFDYGQRHERELEMAAHQARRFEVAEHVTISLDLRRVARSALTADIDVPKAELQGIPPTYVPARNAIFLSLALAWAEELAARQIFIGVNQVDFSGYPDCRCEFIEAFERMAELGTRMGSEGRPVRIRAPLIDMDKAGIIRTGLALGVDFGMTHTCYDPGHEGLACGRCPSCRLRLRGFAEAGIEDPLRYEDSRT
ncbi:MAG: 7-cyano-7-deazaguanine synthase QueC [Deltaproteobacteria bacterium]|nr:7-cyano-7-deazaguanine synthase QueC [Deltaproteobacteria bacterium]